MQRSWLMATAFCAAGVSTGWTVALAGEVWPLDGFSVPESVLHDADRGVL
jgi:hypothetical protein